MSTLTPTPEAINTKRVAAYIAAGKRAKEQRLVAYKNTDGTYSVPSASEAGVEHIVRVTGPRYFDLACDCKGAGHLACTHRYVVGLAARYGVHAARPAVPAFEGAEKALNGRYSSPERGTINSPWMHPAQIIHVQNSPFADF